MTEVNKKWIPFEDENNPVDDKSLKALSQKCSKLEALQTEIDQQEHHIKALKEKQRKLSEEEIPSFLQEKGLTSIRLNNGSQVSVSEDIKPGVLVANRSFCYQWLRDNGFGDLIKNIVSVNFGMGEDKDALQLKKRIEDLGLACAEKEEVHYQTLKAFVGEQHRKGVNLPDEFGVHVANKTKIVQKRKIT
jgi:hypothetical protein